jgi:hypothetical protein
MKYEPSRIFGLCNDVHPNSLSISNRTSIDNGPERQLLDNVNKDLVPVTVLEVKQGFVPRRRNVGMVQHLGD